MNIDIKIKRLRPDAAVPRYATAGSAAVDLHAAIAEPMVLHPHERVSIPTGVAISCGDTGVVAVIAGRSGLGAKYGVSLANGVGVVDSDYRGEIQVTLIHNGTEPLCIEPGDRIAQMMFLPVYAAALIETDTLDETERGEGGFGSTGMR